ncbi:MAG: hypothetical protein GY789_17450 [Hyphomicrobiales bacterium]|nr:hypothetical protein [Hyphomicrobiales bacterium]
MTFFQMDYAAPVDVADEIDDVAVGRVHDDVLGIDLLYHHAVAQDGDAVNLAARLKQLNKEHGTKIIVSGSTVDLLSEKENIEHLGEVKIRGKTKRCGFLPSFDLVRWSILPFTPFVGCGSFPAYLVLHRLGRLPRVKPTTSARKRTIRLGRLELGVLLPWLGPTQIGGIVPTAVMVNTDPLTAENDPERPVAFAAPTAVLRSETSHSKVSAPMVSQLQFPYTSAPMSGISPGSSAIPPSPDASRCSRAR